MLCFVAFSDFGDLCRFSESEEAEIPRGEDARELSRAMAQVNSIALNWGSVFGVLPRAVFEGIEAMVSAVRWR